ncbi:hypothetical protein [Bacillus niameyensis]|uniref:hypothetical protein n=1 Tax=Bacillus niameyensis TaxID=1522308 RepID=UPI000780A427|nr:hypothetical protein [Bacillus niameyensis]
MRESEHPIKYLLRGIVFILYFPFHLTFQIGSFLITYLVVIPFQWLWDRLFKPIADFIWSWLLKPMVHYLVFIPLGWIGGIILIPLWKKVIIPFWKKLLFPILFYTFYYPFYLLWKYVLYWFYREIMLPVLRYCQFVVNLLKKGIIWLWLYIIYYPIRWLWKTFIYAPIRWIYGEIVKPLISWLRKIFT